MNGKKYLLTESDIRQIKDLECGWCADNAGGHFNCAEASKAEQEPLLEANEYRERTCQIEAENAMVDQLIAEHERAEEIAQVALDMLALIRTARLHPLALDPNKGAGGQIVYPLPEQEFADRLRALGVEVS